MKPIGYFVSVVWAIVGIILWVPLLFRSTAAYHAALIGAIIAGRPTKGLGKILHSAITFYPAGFRRIRDSFDYDDTNDPKSPLPLGRIALECLWTAFFWAASGFATHSAIKTYFPESHFFAVVENQTDAPLTISWTYTKFFRSKPKEVSIKPGGIDGVISSASVCTVYFDGLAEPGIQKKFSELQMSAVYGRMFTAADVNKANHYVFRYDAGQMSISQK